MHFYNFRYMTRRREKALALKRRLLGLLAVSSVARMHAAVVLAALACTLGVAAATAGEVPASARRLMLGEGDYQDGEALVIDAWALSGAGTARDRRASTLPKTAPAVFWNRVVQDEVVRYQLNPLRAARLFALMHVAQHDAAVLCARAKLARCGPEQEVAAARVLTVLLPYSAAHRFLRVGAERIEGTGADLENGSLLAVLRVGERAGAAALVHALFDGAIGPRPRLARPAPAPGLWMRTPPLFAAQPLEPGAPGWRTWCTANTQADLAVPAPPDYGSSTYRAQMAEVLDVSRNLDARQTQIAQTWHLDQGSVTPPGVWNKHALEAVLSRRLPADRSASVLARLNAAMFDALVGAWNAKLTWWTERPVTYIQRELDAEFTPLLVTPPFPGYVSGHAAASGAAAAVLGREFPDRAEHFEALAEQAAMSRLYGGIHVRADNEQGLALGRRAGIACNDMLGRP